MHRATANLLLALASAFLTLLLLEAGARVLEDRPETVGPDYHAVRDAQYGYALPPDATWRSVKTHANGTTIYDVSVATDAAGRRTWQHTTHPRALAFYGDSVTFGEGLDVEETLPYLVERDGCVTAYNYAVPGYGPSQALVRIQGKDDLPYAADGVYVLIPAHVNRVVGNTLAPWIYDGPYYRLTGAGLVHAGSFRDGRPAVTALYEAFNALKARSALLRTLRVELPLWGTKRDLETTAAVILAARQAFEARHDGRFIVVFHPDWSRSPDTRGRDELLRLLGDVTVIDYSEHPYPDTKVIPYDQHPTGELNREIGARLVDDLGLACDRNP